MEQSGETATTAVERKRVEAVVETLANSRSQGESLAAVAHDARNMVTALDLYCDLLEEPGVLAGPFVHYGSELRLVASASRRLVEKLVALDNPAASQPSFWRSDAPSSGPASAAGRWPATAAAPLSALEPGARWDLPFQPVANLAAELMATRNLLAALAGASTIVTFEADGGALPVRVSAEDITRILVNLVKNSVEAMPAGGRIQIRLNEHAAEGNRWLVLTVEDNGPGIPPASIEEIFAPGYSVHGAQPSGGHRGLGLAITRSIVEKAGGRIHAENRALGGARIVIELPAAG